MAKIELKKSSTKPSNKSQGAKYSTTNRQGETTYYASSKDASGYSDTFEGKGQTSAGKPLSKVDSAGQFITLDSLKPVPTLELPNKSQVTDIGDVVGRNNQDILSLLGDEYTLDKGKYVYNPKLSETENAVAESNQRGMSNLLTSFGLRQEAPNLEDIYAKSEKEAGVKKARQEVNNYTSQINAITDKRDAEALALEGQGRGITESIIGGQQAQINREAAIAALPIQSQLSAAQGNLELAQSHLDTLFKLRSADATAKWEYQNKLADSIGNFLNSAEQNRLNAKLGDINQRYQASQQNLSMINEWAKMAISTGQSNLVGAFTALDPNSPTFTSDFGKLQGQVRKPVTPTVTKRDTQVVDGKLIDMQTGEIISDIGGGELADDQRTQLSDTLSLARELLSPSATGKSSAIGASLAKFVPYGQTLGLQGNRSAFENRLNTLKANLTLPNLSLLKGPMSDKDILFLQAIGSSLTTGMSETEFDKEVSKVVERFEEKLSAPSLSGTRVITAPDGQQVEIID